MNRGAKMRQFTFLALVFVLSLTIASEETHAASGWSDPVTVSVEDDIDNLSLDMDQNNNWHAVHDYIDSSTGETGIKYLTASSVPVLIAGDGYAPAIAVDSNGALHVTFVRFNETPFYASVMYMYELIPQPVDNPPYFDNASLPSRVTIPNKIYFSGSARDDKGLSQISMTVSGPAGKHTPVSENISGTSRSLGSYYFNSGATDYANQVGSYTVTLTIKDTAEQTETKDFVVTVTDNSCDVANTFEFPLLSGSYYLSQDFGLWNSTAGGYHLGEDYTVSNGEELPVYAPANGVVKHNAQRTSYGYVVIIEHTTEDPNTKACSVLGHLRADGLISLGTKVSKGQLVGYLSNDSAENGGYNFTHLHFGIRHGSYSSTWVYKGYGSKADRGHWWDPSDFLSMHKEEHITWNFCDHGDVDLGWKVQDGRAGNCQGNSWIIDPADGTDKDPAVMSPEYDTLDPDTKKPFKSLHINPGFYNHIEIRMSSNLDNRNAKIYWTSSNYPDPSETQSQSLNLSDTPGDWGYYCWDLSNNPQWLFNGRIRLLRLDFADTGDASGTDVCAVDYIRLTNGSCLNRGRVNTMPWIPMLLLD